MARLKIIDFAGDHFNFSLNKEVSNSYPNLKTIKSYLSNHGVLSWDSSKITFTSGAGVFEWRGNFNISKDGKLNKGSIVSEFERNYFNSSYGHILIDLIEYDVSTESGSLFSLTVPNEIRDILEADNKKNPSLQSISKVGFNYLFSTAYDTKSFKYQSTGGASNDILRSHSDENYGSDLFDGGDGDDQLFGFRGADLLNGGNGTDLLRAGNGRDTIIGGNGSDTMYGGFGLNTFENEADGAVDSLFFKSDQWADNWIYGKAGNSPNGEKADKITELDSFDRIYVQGVASDQLSYKAVSHQSNLGETLTGTGIYASGVLEAVYVGDNLSMAQISEMTQGVI